MLARNLESSCCSGSFEKLVKISAATGDRSGKINCANGDGASSCARLVLLSDLIWTEA